MSDLEDDKDYNAWCQDLAGRRVEAILRMYDVRKNPNGLQDEVIVFITKPEGSARAHDAMLGEWVLSGMFYYMHKQDDLYAG